MGVFDQNYKRLALLIVIALYLTAMYTCEAVLLSTEQQSEGVDTSTFTSPRLVDMNETNETAMKTETKDIGIDLGSIIAFVTYTAPNIHPIFKTILATIVLVFDFILVYLIIDVAYDIIKALPFT